MLGGVFAVEQKKVLEGSWARTAKVKVCNRQDFPWVYGDVSY